ncbi:hypothetical protein LOTGIDRAFT_238973 [Lottia gigantea]|uniref:Oxidative stress-responsive serine-rich protein 1 n=1 Tax=Lottia gigantea TaxID=225164 RepID=V4AUN1_LOTGI|nr:hypothetical protein LOTGIDRAFT_238973 [Lottia gigantea]ESO98650.1 hypothetical protein LOTGIDRAFT_238973 [Lottia gigantea]
MARDEEEGDEIHNSFKKLKIDPEWEKNEVTEREENDCIDINNIWLGGSSTSTCKQKDSSTKRPKHRVSPSRRSEPYPGDWGLSFERLCLRKEKCNKKMCSCKFEKSKHASTLSDKQFNFGSPRKLIQDARLKLHHHHAQKDHRQIIRAAKLQINEAKRLKAEKNKIKKDTLSQVQNDGKTEPIFGSCSTFSPRNFKIVETKTEHAISGKSPSEFFFTGHRNVQTSSNSQSLDLGGAFGKPSTSTDNSNRVEKSCSQEATIEDLSVNELAGYFEDFVHIPKKMSVMAEMMYT